jgi:hypothetical protein
VAAGAEAADQLAQRGEGASVAALHEVHTACRADPDRVEILDVAPRQARNTICGQQGRELRSSRLPPTGPRSWCAGTRFRWSGACTATLSGAVSAGSNAAGAPLLGRHP